MATDSPPVVTALASSEDLALIALLRSGDEAAFAGLVDQYHAAMIRLALNYVGSYSVAEEVAQEAWLGVLKGIDRFEGRSSLKTWIFRILTNTAKTRGERESRIVPFASLATAGEDGESNAFDPDRFQAHGEPNPGHWRSAPTDWGVSPEELALSNEVRACISGAMAGLPPNQREVIRLRDVEGWASDEVCNVLSVSESNQRVLLHRARTKVRTALEDYFNGK